MSRIRGARAESLALDYLRQHGLVPVTRNWLCRAGEIDLICNHDDTLVFIEVRYRRDDRFGGALSSVTFSKRQRVLRAAECYLRARAIPAQRPLRFDLVAISGDLDHPDIAWIQGIIECA